MATTPALKSHWRKVSSTDNLQAFYEDAGAQGLPSKAFTKYRVIGFFMVVCSVVLFAALLVTLVLRLLPGAHNIPQATLSDIMYYVFLVPLVVPMLLIAITANWFCLKLFKHNA